jgi:hypothetical protein
MGRSVIGMRRSPCIVSLKGVLIVDREAVGAYKIRSEKKKRKRKVNRSRDAGCSDASVPSVAPKGSLQFFGSSIFSSNRPGLLMISFSKSHDHRRYQNSERGGKRIDDILLFRLPGRQQAKVCMTYFLPFLPNYLLTRTPTARLYLNFIRITTAERNSPVIVI